MTRRDQHKAIENVLKAACATDNCACYRRADLYRIIEDIMKCFPEPGREDLEHLLEQFTMRVVDEEAIVLPRRSEMRNRFIKKLLAWATGEPEEPRWCEHLVRDQNEWMIAAPAGTWRYAAPHSWDICPVKGCHAPRPASGGS